MRAKKSSENAVTSVAMGGIWATFAGSPPYMPFARQDGFEIFAPIYLVVPLWSTGLISRLVILGESLICPGSPGVFMAHPWEVRPG